MKIRNVTLVQDDHPEYREHCAYYAQADRSLRDTLDPGPQQQLSRAMEPLFRAWLSRHARLSERRILRYERLKRSGQYRAYFKEIDAVEVTASNVDTSDEERPARLFEVKCSSNASSLRSAGSQLMKAIRPLRCRWRGIYRHAVLIAVLPDCMALSRPVTPLENGLPIPEEADPKHRLTTCLSAEELWKWGQDTGTLDAPTDLLKRAQDQARSTIKRREKRKALKQQGVPKAQWPDHLLPARPEVPPTKTATYGNTEAPVSPLARALREAFGENEE